TTLADWIASGDNPYFAKAAVNRVWAHFFGVGITEPVDEPSDDNPPSHPELLGELTKEFVAHKFDLKFLIRAIVNSRTYQLSSTQTDPSQQDARNFGRMALKGLTAEQFFDSLALAVGYTDQNTGQVRVGGAAGGSPRAEFLNKFSNFADKRTEYHTSILQALALMNGRFIADATSEDVNRSVTLTALIDAPFLTNTQRIEALYLATVSRKPRPEEMSRLT